MIFRYNSGIRGGYSGCYPGIKFYFITARLDSYLCISCLYSKFSSDNTPFHILDFSIYRSICYGYFFPYPRKIQRFCKQQYIIINMGSRRLTNKIIRQPIFLRVTQRLIFTPLYALSTSASIVPPDEETVKNEPISL